MADTADKEQSAGIPVDTALRLLGTSRERLKQAERWGFIPKPKRDGYPLAALVNGFCRYLASGETTVEEGGQLIGTSGEWVRRLIIAGYIQRNERGNVTKEAVASGYVRFLQDEDRKSTKVAAESGLKQARQREVELRIAERERTVIDLAEHFAVVEELCGMFNASLNGLPARVTRDLPMRRKIEIDIDEIRRQIVVRSEQRSSELRAGRSVAAADPEDDA